MRIAYFECSSGISGDMTLGALIDAGVDHAAIARGIESLGLPGCKLVVETVRRGGFRATAVRVDAPPEHAHRHLSDILHLVERSRLSGPQKDLATRIFRRLGEAEATVHGQPVEKVHFHEVGAVDSIADILGAAIGIDLLGAERIVAGPVPTGRGRVKIAHGTVPIPAPGTAELLKGVPLVDLPIEAELTTPTGAAILTTVADEFGPLPEITVERIGYGAGSRELAEQPNVLRLFVGTSQPTAEADRISVLETNLDDIPAELVGYCYDRLLEAGALDVFTTPIQMKKNRPGVLLSVLCQESDRASLQEIIFRETATLGIRRYAVLRDKLRREPHQVETRFGPIRGKLGWLNAQSAVFSPEYDDCARIAAAQRVPLRDVYEAATRAYTDSLKVEG